MSVSEIKEKENGSAFEVILKSPQKDASVVLAKKKVLTPNRKPLVDRLDNASKRYEEQLNEKKNKAAEKFTKVLKIKEDQVERIESQKQATTERIKSADTKRRSILDEKVEKAKADVEKAKKLSAEKREQEDKQLKALQNKIVEKKAKAEELHAKQIEIIKEKAKVKLTLTDIEQHKLRVEQEFREQTAAKLNSKLSSVDEKRAKILAEEQRKLKEHHEKVSETQKKVQNSKKQDE
jgi:hypothetical protein